MTSELKSDESESKVFDEMKEINECQKEIEKLKEKILNLNKKRSKF